MMAKIISTALLLFFLNACDDEYVKPTFFYKAPFHPSMVDGVEIFMRDMSEKWELRLFEKPRNQMKYLTQDQEAFFVAFYLNDEDILDISNVGVGIILTLALFDHGDMPLVELERLSEEVRTGLKDRFDIKFAVADP